MPIIHDNIEFHNVAELVSLPHPAGLALYRYPRAVIPHLIDLGQHSAASSDGVELRFRSGVTWLSLTLSARSNYAWVNGATVEVYRGDIPVSNHFIPDGATQTIKLTTPPNLGIVKPESLQFGRYAPDLWRVVCSNTTVIYHGLATGGQPVHPPQPHEKPRQGWLAYGSSITNAMPGYVSHAARHLGVDVLNKGLCGSCFCEPETARYLAQGDDWDIATLELGVNMRSCIEPAEFEKRVRGMLAEFRAVAPTKPVVLITIFPNSDDYARVPGLNAERNQAYRSILRVIHTGSGDRHLHLIEGTDILPSMAGLTGDLIHPSPDGHQLMGFNLAARLRPLLNL